MAGILLSCVITISLAFFADGANVIYAVNAGGGHHVGGNGIRFIADPSSVGVASDYGLRFNIKRASPEDQILYQTERWHHESFSYVIPIKSDGEYVLVLKFAEVYFNSPEQKVFDIQLNNHQVVANLDIFDKVGHATAHDEVIPFSVHKGKLKVGGESSSYNGALALELSKGAADNPKVCAFYVLQGSIDDVVALPPLDLLNKAEEEDEEEDDDEEEISPQDDPDFIKKSSGSKDKRDRKIKSGPPAINPYAEDNSSLILPIVIAFSAFIPTLVCLCRL